MIDAGWSLGRRLGLLAGLFIMVAIVVLANGPIPQDPAYHLFADRRICLGITNFADVTSNLGFALVGLTGIWFVLRPKATIFQTMPMDRRPYLVFFAGLALVSIGSAYYHAAPDNNRLLWDRLPMTIAFMALSAAFVADRIDRNIGVRWLLPGLVALGMASVIYWHWTETQGVGDLRLYLLVQFFPMLALPVICWTFPNRRLTNGKYLFWMLLWYGAARIPEIYDRDVFALLGQGLSGHTIKHVLSAIVGLVVMRMLAVVTSGGQLK